MQPTTGPNGHDTALSVRTVVAIIGAFVGAATTFISTVGGIILANARDSIQELKQERRIDKEETHAALAALRSEAGQARAELRTDVGKEFERLELALRARAELYEGNRAAIVALQAADVEIETQLRAMATVSNLDRALREAIEDLMQQCPTCKRPQRTYYPPGPGPGGTNGQH